MTNKLRYSKIAAGTMTWGSWGKALNTTQMIALMQHCIANGVTTFDHADIYGDYGNEALFGKAFKESKIARESIQVVSKCGIQMTSGRENTVKHYQYDADYIVYSAERSIKQLNAGYIDLFLLHRPSPLMQPAEVAAAFAKLKSSGKVKQFGVSNFTPSQIALLEKEVKIEANQVEFSITHLNPMYDGTFDDCIINDRLAMAWSPLGNYFREGNEQNKRLKAVLEKLAKKYEVNESMLLLAFIMKHPAQVMPVVGTATKERITDSLKAAQIQLDLQDWFLLLEASNGNEAP
ncbi:aldo/keto reductase [Croceivirga radicis]|uniref:Aldo/keto reductase n=1 Tax=Croceivirga radicis TaxID=1929488 RepID=A0A1V6LW15_9FLAO|nr:aldo/keto reductase [Croceivirga radicis]OQD44372.1 aldo/keto reductase [Croceivirga radicis]